MGSPYLESVHIDHFGAWHDKTTGPFGPNLNVVFGHNEAGKTTLASFIKGVFVKWERASVGHNNFKPDDAERSGTLFFAEESDKSASPKSSTKLYLTRNSSGLQGDETLINDADNITKETYQAVFSLTGDELIDLDEQEITRRLLTAGSGTVNSPASALETIESRLAEFTSRAEGASQSLVRLQKEEDEVQAALTEAQQKANVYRTQEQEFLSLSPKKDALGEEERELDAAIEQLSSLRAELKSIDEALAEQQSIILRESDKESHARREQQRYEQDCESSLVSLNDAQDRSMRDKIDDLVEQETRLTQATAEARRRSHDADAYLEALNETASTRSGRAKKAQDNKAQDNAGSNQKRTHSTSSRKIVQTVVLAVIFALLLVFGIALFIAGSRAGSLSYAALGGVLIVAGLALAIVVLVSFRRSNKDEEEHDQLLNHARQEALQEQKKLEACLADEEDLANQIQESLADMGLSGVGSSLRRARDLLDDTREVRLKIQHARDQQEEAAICRDEASARVDTLEQQRLDLCEQAGVSSAATPTELDKKISELTSRRTELNTDIEKTNNRLGELKQILNQAQSEHEFDRLKNELEDIRTREEEAIRDFARLSLAQRMLSRAIESWNEKSQPEVYKQASRLFSLMTGGRWNRIDRLDNGTFQISDSFHNVLAQPKLSLGTCQQLYLSLRIALLMCADNVGRAIPIVADDILVNFDATRREGAARALAELAKMRQVIVLTCHEEVVNVIQQVDEDAQVINL